MIKVSEEQFIYVKNNENGVKKLKTKKLKITKKY